jgi:hypothetical protein
MKPSLEDTVSLKTAFIIMQRFLEAHWRRTGATPNALGDVLSSISMLQDGKTADPAMMHDWLDAATAVISSTGSHKPNTEEQ